MSNKPTGRLASLSVGGVEYKAEDLSVSHYVKPLKFYADFRFVCSPSHNDLTWLYKDTKTEDGLIYKVLVMQNVSKQALKSIMSIQKRESVDVMNRGIVYVLGSTADKQGVMESLAKAHNLELLL